MDKTLQKFLQLEFFSKEGFVRKKCTKCASFFWTFNRERQVCGDAPCIEYTFIGKPLGKKKYDLSSMREAFLSFFERYDHTRLTRYPVVARWRSDVYLTIASIADFQPHATSGEVPPPANPLVISQPSIRLNDLEEVGRSGRHLTMFEMMGHHAFNNHEKVYWTEETVRYCHEFLILLGLKKEDVTYKEAEWSGGGNAGPCLEVLVGGLEIATLVFMNLKSDDHGKYVIKGEKYAEMPMKIVDTGYGLERFVWLTRGSKTIYDAIFPEMISFLKKEAGLPSKALNEKEKETLNALYAVADHTRCLAFMLGDGIIPSNAEAGYLARLVIRRALRLLSYASLTIPLSELVERHVDTLSKDFPELKKKRVTEILEREEEKFSSTLSKGRRLVARYMREKKRIPLEKLIEFYDTHGIPPEIVRETAGNIHIPENFDSIAAERHSIAQEEVKKEETFSQTTKPLFYEKPYEREFDAEVLWQGKVNGTHAVILDKTLFYPEGGGQESDTGFLSNKKKWNVMKAEKRGNAILHFIDSPIPSKKVHGIIDWQRRCAMMRHHTATHVINASARSVLGEHIWQAGSQLDENEARLDVSHYKRISPDELREVEQKANEIVRERKEVKKYWMKREEAEKKHGLHLYQGGAPKGRMLRIVEIPGIEVEACGGTHIDNTAELGFIKIIGTERVQDGVERIKFSAGEKSIEYVQQQEKLLREASDILAVEPSLLPKTVKRFFEEWKQLRKQIEKLQRGIIKNEIEQEVYKGVKFIVQDEMTASALKEITKKPKTFAISGNRLPSGNAVVTIARSSDITIDCAYIAKEIGKSLGGSGGGKPEVAQAGGPKVERLEEAKKRAVALVKKQLKGKNL